MNEAWAWTDGSNGRSKGPAGAAAFVIADAETQELLEERCFKFPHPVGGRLTSNDMEMAAVYLCVQTALFLGVDNLFIHSDSEWTVKILQGEYQLKNPKFFPVVEDIRRVGSLFHLGVNIRHVRREQNLRADWLCSVATMQKRADRECPQIEWVDWSF